jgi:hypothetical protein
MLATTPTDEINVEPKGIKPSTAECKPTIIAILTMAPFNLLLRLDSNQRPSVGMFAILKRESNSQLPFDQV